MDKLNVVCLSTETGNAIAYLIDGLAIHMDLESLQRLLQPESGINDLQKA